MQPTPPPVLTPEELATPSYQPPYEADTNGVCADGHPLNGFGRCQPLNAAAAATVSPAVP